MDLTKRKIFALLLGASGVILILMASFISFESSTHQVFLVAANFHNSSLSYLTALNLSFNIIPAEERGLKNTLTKELFTSLDNTKRNPKIKDANVTDVELRNVNVHNKSNLHNKASSDVNNEIRTMLASESVQSNEYQSTSDIIEPRDKNQPDSLGRDSDLGSQDDDPRETNIRRKSKLSDLIVNDINRNPRLIPGQSALNDKNSVLIHDDHARDFESKDSLINQGQDFDSTDKRRPLESQETTALTTVGDYVKPGILDHVNPEHIYEEVKFKDIDNSENVVNARGGYAGEMKPENNEDLNYLKKTLESSNDAKQGNQKALSHQESMNQREFDNNVRISEIPNLEQHNVIPSQNGQHSVGGQIYHQGQSTFQDELNGNRNLGLIKVENQTASADIKVERKVNLNEGFVLDPSCRSRRVTGVEDIFCMKRPNFSRDYRNPCWYQHSSLKCLPYFHIIGVCKTGTTDLFERLSHHPQIIKNKGILGKETWYWTWKRYGHSHFHRQNSVQMTLKEFIDMFDSSSIERHTKRLSDGSLFHPAVTGHGDPMDFWDQSSWKLIPQNDPTSDVPEVTAPSLIKHVNPNIKLILLLRDPIERLFSNYLHGKFGTSSTQFHVDVQMSVSLLTSCTRSRSMKSCLYDEDIIRSLRVPISGSFYAIHLQEWLKVFPRKQIYITRTEDFSKSIADSLIGIFRFLKLDPVPTRDLYRIANMPHFYDTKAKQTAGEILDETRTILRSLFQPYNNELATILNDQKYTFNDI